MRVIVPKMISSELAEEIGWHLGDGSMNYYNGKGLYQLRGHSLDDRQHYQCRVRPLMQKLFSCQVNLRDMKTTGVYGFQIWSDELVEFKVDLGLPLGKKFSFKIPDCVFVDDECKKSFVRGFFDTDGCLYVENKQGKQYPRIEMCSISELFIGQLHVLLLELGFVSTMFREKRSHKGWQDIFKIRINGIVQTDKWFSEIKPANQKHIDKYDKIKKDGPAEI